MFHTCPVCGYPNLTEPPRSEQGGGSYEYCPSCRFQFGYTDDALHLTYEQWRKQWADKGMPWSSKSIKLPTDWNPKKQLQNIGINLD